jgi:hypothetical protein
MHYGFHYEENQSAGSVQEQYQHLKKKLRSPPSFPGNECIKFKRLINLAGVMQLLIPIGNEYSPTFAIRPEF